MIYFKCNSLLAWGKIGDGKHTVYYFSFLFFTFYWGDVE